MSRPRAYQLMESAGIAKALSTTVDNPPTAERQIRPLAKLNTQEQRDAAWITAESIARDENLMRSELTATEYAEHMQRRKEIWEAMQSQTKPESQSGSSCATFDAGGRGNEGFAEATAKSTGKSKASTNRATRRAREVMDQALQLPRNGGIMLLLRNTRRRTWHKAMPSGSAHTANAT